MTDEIYERTLLVRLHKEDADNLEKVISYYRLSTNKGASAAIRNALAQEARRIEFSQNETVKVE